MVSKSAARRSGEAEGGSGLDAAGTVLAEARGPEADLVDTGQCGPLDFRGTLTLESDTPFASVRLHDTETFLVHDGDQDKSGVGTGEACVNTVLSHP